MGTVDPLYGIGRSSYETCKWWKRQSVVDPKTGKVASWQIVHNIVPEGEFKAEEVSAISTIASGLSDMQGAKMTVTLSTVADIDGQIKFNDLVEYQGRIWRVQSVEKTEHWARSYYGRKNWSGTKTLVLVS